METFGKFMLGLILLTASIFFNAFVLIKLWGWFIATTFHTIHLSIPQALGISLFVGYITYKDTKADSDEKNRSVFEIFLIKFFTMLCLMGFALLYGWIISLFI